MMLFGKAVLMASSQPKGLRTQDYSSMVCYSMVEGTLGDSGRLLQPPLPLTSG